MSGDWISTDARLPKDGTYVLIHLISPGWVDSTDQEHVAFVVAKFATDRLGGGNNRRPYIWREFGPASHWGQDVDYWMPIPDLP